MMIKTEKISFKGLFGDIAKNIYYEFDIVFTKESIEKNGFVFGNNISVMKGNIIDDEKLLDKLFCNKQKWMEAAENMLSEKNFHLVKEIMLKNKDINLTENPIV